MNQQDESIVWDFLDTLLSGLEEEKVLSDEHRKKLRQILWGTE